MSALQATVASIKNYCAYQERCHKEVRTKLLELGEYGEDLEEVIAILISENYLNEERFAQLYAPSKFNQLNWGRIKITQALKAKDVSEYCIKKGLAEISEKNYTETLKYELNKKAITLKSEKNIWTKKTKIKNYLLQKGFETNLILKELEIWFGAVFEEVGK